MDKITEMTGSTNYIASFIICDFFLLATIVCVCLIDKVIIICDFFLLATIVCVCLSDKVIY